MRCCSIGFFDYVESHGLYDTETRRSYFRGIKTQDVPRSSSGPYKLIEAGSRLIVYFRPDKMFHRVGVMCRIDYRSGDLKSLREVASKLDV